MTCTRCLASHRFIFHTKIFAVSFSNRDFVVHVFAFGDVDQAKGVVFFLLCARQATNPFAALDSNGDKKLAVQPMQQQQQQKKRHCCWCCWYCLLVMVMVLLKETLALLDNEGKVFGCSLKFAQEVPHHHHDLWCGRLLRPLSREGSLDVLRASNEHKYHHSRSDESYCYLSPITYTPALGVWDAFFMVLLRPRS